MPSPLARFLFDVLAFTGRPFGGFRPRRLYHALARAGFGPTDVRRVKDAQGNTLTLRPHSWVDRHLVAFGQYDADLSRFIRAQVKPGDVCLDVGANIGLVALELARRVASPSPTGTGGHVHAFEPVPDLFERLRAHVADNGLDRCLTAHPLALSDRPGTMPFHLAPAESENQGMGSLFSTTHQVASLTRQVQVTTLDAFAETLQLTRLDFIKVDIQGAELRFVEGAAKTLARFGPDLMMEVSSEDLAQAGTSAAALLARLEALGYRCHAVRRGRAVERLVPERLPADFSAGNVLCTQRAS